jgi:predicted NUDIX family NTP pyrophosphohydrolase
MAKNSAGLLLYRNSAKSFEVFLVHPGGPFWSRRDEGSWSIPKGEFTEGENPLEAAKREFREETGLGVDGQFEELHPVSQPGGKTVYAWAVEGDLDVSAIRSNNFSIEWPPKSGKIENFPEVDRGAWFNFDLARRKMLKGQIALLDQLQQKLGDKIRNISEP